MKAALLMLAIAIGPLLALSGCASTPPEASSFVIPSNEYQRTFDEARETLLSRNYRLNRVDAHAGVITTQPAGSAGLLAPWGRRPASLGEGVEETLNQHVRVATVRFLPLDDAEGGEAAPTSPGVRDVREHRGELRVDVTVSVERVHVPGRRIESAAIGLSTTYADPMPGRRYLWPRYNVPERVDTDAALELSSDLRSRLD